MMITLSSYRYLETERLILRPLTLKDASAVFLYTSDPLVARYTHWHQHRTLEQTVSYLHMITQNQPTHVWGIELRSTGALIGECSVTQHEDGRAELYYALNRTAWGNGYTPEALLAVLETIQKIPHISRIEAWIIAQNYASCRAAQKAGLCLEHTLFQAWNIEHTPHDIALYIAQYKKKPLI